MNDILIIDNLSKTYYTKTKEVEAIKDISLNIKEGEFIAIVGPSGCGKSTLLNIIGDLDTKTNGNIKFPLKSNNKLGYMFQQDCLFDWLTILDNCLLGLKIQKQLTNKNKKRALDLLENYGLKSFINSYPKNLSGGMRQRVLRIRYTHGMITYKWLITLINKEKEVYYVIR